MAAGCMLRMFHTLLLLSNINVPKLCSTYALVKDSKIQLCIMDLKKVYIYMIKLTTI